MFTMILMATILQRDLVIIHDDSKESKIILAELKRDWTVKEDIPSAVMAIQRGRQQWVRSRTKLVKGDKLYYKFGDYGKVEHFDERMFMASGMCLYSLEAIIVNFSVNLSEWEQNCERIKNSAESVYAYNIYTWLRKKHSIDDSYTYDVATIKKDYGHLTGFFEYVEPSYPPNPMMLFPWEGTCRSY